MADKKYAAFCFSSFVKLIIYLVLCGAAYFVSRFLDGAAQQLMPTIVAIIINMVFLSAVEGGKRSFLAKGYMIENIVTGAVYAIVMVAVGAVVLFAAGKLQLGGLSSGFDLTKSALDTVQNFLFPAVVIFGYFYHIQRMDFGMYTAIILSALLFVLFDITAIHMSFSQLIENITYIQTILTLVNLLLVGLIAGMLQIFMGDVRSSSAFLCFYGFMRGLICGTKNSASLFTVSGEFDIDTSIYFLPVLIITVIILITSIKQKND